MKPLCLWLSVVTCCAFVALTSLAEAAVQRFALIAGNNHGQGDDVPLRYAESDARRVAQVLRDLGGFEPADIVLLQNENADTVRRSLISLNDRIRSAQSLPDTQALLFVYYSGHADGLGLHLGPTTFELRELSQLVRGSSARFRLLVVDACQSGALTRVKGGKIVAPFSVDESQLGGEGMAFLTAASGTEDAQESDELKASFFTHALVSGLLGAADRNADGEVLLEEAYQYAYHATLAATSRTWLTQHPTFQYEVKGQGGLVLTRPGLTTMTRARLVFPKGIDYLVFGETARGQVLAEVNGQAAGRSLSLPPGRYFVRGRARDYLLEGTVHVAAGSVHTIDPGTLDRVAYARLVRKRGGYRQSAASLELGAAVREPLSETLTRCLGATAGARLDFESLGLAAHLGGCRGEFENTALRARNYEADLALQGDHTWDFAAFSLALGGGVGGRVVHQSFDSDGIAPSRTAFSPFAFLALAPSLPITSRTYVTLDARFVGYLQRHQATATEPTKLLAPLSARGALLVGFRL